MQKILITGGSGLLGTALTKVLQQQGYTVSHLGRKRAEKNGIITYRWDYKENYIDPEALAGVDYIINLAGANVAGGRWTAAYKKEIYDSRVKSTRLLYEAVKNSNTHLKKIISASAVGYYGSNKDLVTEDTPAGTDFLAKVCADWEAEAQQFAQLGIPVTILRIGVVVAREGGFAVEMAKPVKMGFGAALGSGQQQISWIHIDDLCAIVLKAITEDAFTGVYNSAAPVPATNQEVTKTIAKILGKPLWLPKVPAFALKIILGGMSVELLTSHNASAQKVMNAGFVFKHPLLEEALRSALK